MQFRRSTRILNYILTNWKQTTALRCYALHTHTVHRVDENGEQEARKNNSSNALKTAQIALNNSQHLSPLINYVDLWVENLFYYYTNTAS